MIEVVQAFDRAPITQLDSDDDVWSAVGV